jgi:CcmD family protein
MGNLGFLFAAYAAIWTALFIFMLQIARRLSSLQRDVETLKQDVKK